jgi:hypothetical protein
MADLEGTELCDSHLDIHELFAYYNDTYFEGKLDACTVAWSSLQMTLYVSYPCFLCLNFFNYTEVQLSSQLKLG